MAKLENELPYAQFLTKTLALFQEELTNKSLLAQKSQELYYYDVCDFISYLDEKGLSFLELDTPKLKEYFDTLSHYSYNYQRRKLTSIKSFYLFLYKNNIANKLLIDKVEEDIFSASTLPRVSFSEKELNIFFKSLSTEGAKKLIIFIFYALIYENSLKVADILRIKVEDINYPETTKIRYIKSSGLLEIWLSNNTSELLKKYLELTGVKEGLLFTKTRTFFNSHFKETLKVNNLSLDYTLNALYPEDNKDSHCQKKNKEEINDATKRNELFHKYEQIKIGELN